MSFVPTAKIYASDAATLVYNLGNMLEIDGWPNDEEPNQIVLSNLRSQGEIIIPAGNLAFDITITGRLTAANYTALITAWNSLQSTIAVQTNYYLKIDTSSTTQDSIKIQRLKKIIPIKTNNWVSWVYFSIVFRCNCW